MASLKTARNGDASELGPAVRKRLLQVTLMFLILAAALFVSAGCLDWWAA
jgi:hypothetical protein